MNANSIAVGNVIKLDNRFWLITKKEHVKPGKGGAFVQAEMKDILSGTKRNEKFRSEEKIEKAFMEEKVFTYQYDEGESLAFMNMETFEQESFSKELIGDKFPFLQEGMDIKVCYCEEKPIYIKIPETVILAISETEPAIKGQTVTNSFKPAILENGVRVMVPPFVTTEDKIVVKTDDSTYVERAK